MIDEAKDWPLHEAKARFSELIRRTQTEGPQRVTVHGKHAATIIAAPTSSRKKLTGTGMDLVRALQSCPFPDFEIPEREKNSRFRDVDL
jgi:prevent-host-death family protein